MNYMLVCWLSIIFFSFISIFCIHLIYVNVTIYSAFQIKLGEMKQTFRTINLKFKIKIYLCRGGAALPLNHLFITQLTWVKYLKSLINSRNCTKILIKVRSKSNVEIAVLIDFILPCILIINFMQRIAFFKLIYLKIA